MSKQFRIQRTYAQIPVVAGGFALIDLPRGYDYETLYIRLVGNVQVTTAGVGVRTEAPCQAIARVELVADGRNTLHSAPYWNYVLGHYDRRQNQSGSRNVTPPSAATVGTYAVEALGCVDFFTPDGVRAKDSNFRTDGLQLFQLRLTFGLATDLFGGASVANFQPGMMVEISTSEIVELPDPATGVRTSPVALKKVSFQELGVPTTNANQEIRLPAGNMIKSVLVRTEFALNPDVTILNNIQAFSGVDVRVNMKAASLRGKNNDDFGLVPAGYYVLDFARSGSDTASLSELWDVTNQAEPKLSLDVVGSASTKIQAVVTEYIGLGK
jgi:hypothetical protein